MAPDRWLSGHMDQKGAEYCFRVVAGCPLAPVDQNSSLLALWGGIDHDVALYTADHDYYLDRDVDHQQLDEDRLLEPSALGRGRRTLAFDRAVSWLRLCALSLPRGWLLYHRD